MKSKYLFLQLPRSGLCNKLLIWAGALVWSHKHQVNLIVKGWFHLPIGSMLRFENKKRYYSNFFISNSKWTIFPAIKFRNSTTITSIDSPLLGDENYFRYKSEAYIKDFTKLAPYHNLIVQSFFKLIRPTILMKAESIQPPFIAVHIRKGDFVKIGFAIELDYYVNAIHQLRSKFENTPHVVVFSDGFEHELAEVLNLTNVSLFPTENDLIDLLVMSKTKILITAYESSYSYWAAFISNAVVLHHPKATVVQSRPVVINNNLYEGVFPLNSHWPSLLESNISALKHTIN